MSLIRTVLVGVFLIICFYMHDPDTIIPDQRFSIVKKCTIMPISDAFNLILHGHHNFNAENARS